MEKFDWYGKNDAINAYLIPAGKTVAALSDDVHSISAELVIKSSGVLRYKGETYENPKAYPKELKDILAHDAYGIRHAASHNEGLDILEEASAEVRFSAKEPRKKRILLESSEYRWFSPVQDAAWSNQTHLQDEVLTGLRDDLRAASLIYDYLQQRSRNELTSSAISSIHDLAHSFGEAGEFLCDSNGRIREEAKQSEYVHRDESYPKHDIYDFDMAKAYFGEKGSSCLVVENVDRGYLNFYLGRSCFFQKTPFDRDMNIEAEVERRLQDIYLGQDSVINQRQGDIAQNTLLMQAALSHYMGKAHERETQRTDASKKPKRAKKAQGRTRKSAPTR